MKPGDVVISRYRMPCPHQWWNSALHIGVVEEPGDDPKEWNGTNSERHYCEVCKKSRVRYAWGVMHDSTENLMDYNDPAVKDHLVTVYGENVSRLQWTAPAEAFHSAPPTIAEGIRPRYEGNNETL